VRERGLAGKRRRRSGFLDQRAAHRPAHAQSDNEHRRCGEYRREPATRDDRAHRGRRGRGEQSLGNRLGEYGIQRVAQRAVEFAQARHPGRQLRFTPQRVFHRLDTVRRELTIHIGVEFGVVDRMDSGTHGKILTFI
jgi:hypothetical protein